MGFQAFFDLSWMLFCFISLPPSYLTLSRPHHMCSNEWGLQIGKALNNLSFKWKLVKFKYQTPRYCNLRVPNLELKCKGGFKGHKILLQCENSPHLPPVALPCPLHFPRNMGEVGSPDSDALEDAYVLPAIVLGCSDWQYFGQSCWLPPICLPLALQQLLMLLLQPLWCQWAKLLSE